MVSRGLAVRVAILATLLALVVYLLTLAPGISWHNDGADSGDLVAAVATGGVPHPSGYPTYLLVGSLFARLPVGDLAYRLNVMSAAAAAGATGLTLLAILASLNGAGYGKREVRLFAAGAAALTFAFSSILWSQAVIAEVYALNALFAAGVGCLALLARATGRWWLWVAAAGAFGLGLGNHLSLITLAPVGLVLYGASWWSGVRRSQSVSVSVATETKGARPGVLGSVAMLLAFTAGLAVYLALPLRAAQQPPVNWGGAHTWDGFIWLVSGQAYAPLVAALPLTQLPGRILAAAALLCRQAAWWGVPVVYLGVRAMWERDRPLAMATLLGGVVLLVYAVGYNTSDSYVYLIPVAMILAFWIGWGLPEAFEQIGSLSGGLSATGRRVAGWALRGGAVLLISVPLAANFQTVDASHDLGAHDYGVKALTSAARSAVIIADSGTDTFPLWYFRYAEGRRPDVAIVNGHLLAYAWYRDSVRRWHPDVAGVADESDAAQVVQTLIQVNLPQYPVYLTTTTWELPAGYRLAPEGILYRVERDWAWMKSQ